MDELKEYIEKLKTSSFEGWSEDSINGYITALTSIEEFCFGKIKFENIIEETERWYPEDMNYFIEESILYEIDNPELGLSINNDENSIDIGESMCWYGATVIMVEKIVEYISKKLEIDISDIDCGNIPMYKLMKICYDRYSSDKKMI